LDSWSYIIYNFDYFKSHFFHPFHMEMFGVSKKKVSVCGRITAVNKTKCPLVYVSCMLVQGCWLDKKQIQIKANN